MCSVISTALCISDMSLKCSKRCDLTYFLEWLLPHQNRLTLVTCLVLLAHRNSIRNKVAAKRLSLFRGLKWHSHFQSQSTVMWQICHKKTQNACAMNTVYRFKGGLVKLSMVVLVNKFDTHLREVLNLPCIKPFLYVSARTDGTDTHWFCWRSYTSKHSITTSLSVSTENTLHNACSASVTYLFWRNWGLRP